MFINNDNDDDNDDILLPPVSALSTSTNLSTRDTSSEAASLATLVTRRTTESNTSCVHWCIKSTLDMHHSTWLTLCWLVESSRRPCLRSADTADYIKRRTQTKFGERCFSHAGPAAWNSLPDSIKLTTDTNRFRNLLKTHLFHLAFISAPGQFVIRALYLLFVFVFVFEMGFRSSGQFPLTLPRRSLSSCRWIKACDVDASTFGS